MKRIEYLDLELNTYHSKKNLDRYCIDYNIEGNFRYNLHTEILS